MVKYKGFKLINVIKISLNKTPKERIVNGIKVKYIKNGEIETIVQDIEASQTEYEIPKDVIEIIDIKIKNNKNKNL